MLTEVHDAAEKAKNTTDNVIADANRTSGVIYAIELAKEKIKEMASAVANASKAAEEANKWVSEAQKAISSQETESAVSQAKKSANEALAAIELMKKLISLAQYEESAYLLVVNEANDAANKAKVAMEKAAAKPFIHFFKTPLSKYIFDVNTNQTVPVSLGTSRTPSPTIRN